MHPKRIALGLVAALTLVFTATPGSAQENFDNVQIQVTDLGGGVYLLMGAGGNIGLSVGDDVTFLVDDQFAPLTEKITAAIAAITDMPVEFLLNTHWHGDHTGGNENLGKAGALIFAHENVRARMSVTQNVFGRDVPAAPPVALPVITFNDTTTFHINGQTVYVRHVPNSHTDGDSIVYFREADVLHMADSYFSGMYPFIDVGSGGSIEGMIEAVNVGLELAGPATKIIPGHGPLSNRAELVAYRDMLVSVRDLIAAAIGEGKSKDDIVAAKPSRELDGKWGGVFVKPDNFVQTVFADLSRAR